MGVLATLNTKIRSALTRTTGAHVSTLPVKAPQPEGETASSRKVVSALGGSNPKWNTPFDKPDPAIKNLITNEEIEKLAKDVAEKVTNDRTPVRASSLRILPEDGGIMYVLGADSKA
jgi:hypothetical protein